VLLNVFSAHNIQAIFSASRVTGESAFQQPASTGSPPVNVRDNSTLTPWSVIFGTDHLRFSLRKKPTRKTKKFLFAADNSMWRTPAWHFPEPQSHYIGGTAHCHESESCTWQQ
jgi:hypothetical protein